MRGKRIALAAALLHLVLIACLAGHVPIALGDGPAANLVWYFGVSGINTRYGFFAPNVGTNLRARFEIVENGRVTTEILEQQASAESRIRMGNLVALFGRYVANPKLERSLTASWAGWVLGQYPEAKEVTVFIDVMLLPDLKSYREGARPDWKEIYKAKFERERTGAV